MPIDDAEAIGEASRNPKTVPVPVKTLEQQDLTMLIAIRQGLVEDRTALANRIRAFLLERSFTLPKGINALRTQLSSLLDDGTNSLTLIARSMLRELQDEIRKIDEKVEDVERRMREIAQRNAAAKILLTVPGFGSLVVAALVAVIGDPRRFANGRDMSAYLGLVVRQNTSGDKIRLGGITKRGDAGLRALLIHGARAALRCIETNEMGKRWATDVSERGVWPFWPERTTRTKSWWPWSTSWCASPGPCGRKKCPTMRRSPKVGAFLRRNRGCAMEN